MKPRLLAAIAAILVIVSGVAWTTWANVKGATCHRTATYERMPDRSYLPTPEPFNGATIGKTRPYSEFYADLLAFGPKLNEAYDKVASNAPFEIVTKARDEVTDYISKELYGNHISDWPGWIVATGAKAVEAAPFLIDPIQDDSNAVLIYMSNPFTTTIRTVAVSKEGYKPNPIEIPYIVVSHATEKLGQHLCLGQKVSVNGDVTWPPKFSDSTAVTTLANGTLSIQEDNFARSVGTSEPIDIIINFKVVFGWGASGYELTLYGDGTLVYFGHGYSLEQGYHITSVGRSADREIEALFDQANFYNLHDYGYDHLTATDCGSERFSITKGTTSKSVFLTCNSTTPEAVNQLGQQFLKITGANQWVDWNR